MPTKSDVVALAGARAVARHVRISPMKARRMVDLVRGLPAREALTVLQFAPQAASDQVYKVVASAVANAENNERLDPDSLLISAAFVDEGPTLKRFRPRAQGRAYRIRKRTCHITIEVESVVPRAPVKKAAVKKAATASAEVKAPGRRIGDHRGAREEVDRQGGEEDDAAAGGRAGEEGGEEVRASRKIRAGQEDDSSQGRVRQGRVGQGPARQEGAKEDQGEAEAEEGTE